MTQGLNLMPLPYGTGDGRQVVYGLYLIYAQMFLLNK